MSEEDNIIRFQDLKTISIKENKKEIFSCKHSRITVTESNWPIKCRDCNEVIDPLWWITQVAREEQLKSFVLENLVEEIENLKQKIREMNRTKCEHCSRFTKIDKNIFYTLKEQTE